MKTAIILCSGGIDSVTTAYYVKKTLKYEKLIFLFFNYNQRTLKQERNASKLFAKKLKCNWIEISLPFLGKISTSLINSKKNANKISKKDLKNTKNESENYYVPCRNTIFLTHALALAESLQIKKKITPDIFVGFKNEGKEPYPDTTPEYLKKMNELSKISCIKNFKILAPLIKKDKEDIIKMGQKFQINYKDTFTCYIGRGKKHCGTCLSCQLRKQGFYWAGIPDPTIYN